MTYTSHPYSEFCKNLISDINAYRKRYGEHANQHFWVKAILLCIVWVLSYCSVVFIGTNSYLIDFLLALIWGVTSLLLIFNIGHDAVHGSISKHKWVNNSLQYVFNLVGGNAYSWRLKHNLAHHIHTNIEGQDFDTDLYPLMRLSPQSRHLRHYKLQHIYYVLVYPLLSLLIIGIGDFKIFSQSRKSGLVLHHPFKEYLMLIVSKLWYVTIALLIPIYATNYSLEAILGTLLIIHLVNGAIISVVFMPSHYFPKSNYYSEKAKEYNWFEHQIDTTMDLSPNSTLLTHLLGGLNLNVEHHLFPKFCHIHYAKIKQIIENRAHTHKIKTHRMGIGPAWVDHVRHLKSLGKRNA